MKRKNTDRDNLIRSVYKKGDGGMMGGWWGISRQRVWQVLHEGKPKRKWWLFWRK